MALQQLAMRRRLFMITNSQTNLYQFKDLIFYEDIPLRCVVHIHIYLHWVFGFDGLPILDSQLGNWLFWHSWINFSRRYSIYETNIYIPMFLMKQLIKSLIIDSGFSELKTTPSILIHKTMIQDCILFQGKKSLCDNICLTKPTQLLWFGSQCHKFLILFVLLDHSLLCNGNSITSQTKWLYCLFWEV